MIQIAEPSIGKEEIAAVTKVLESGILAKGPVVKKFEEEFAELCGTDHAVAVNSGTAALHAALVCAGVGAGDEVIVPTFTFFATASAVKMCGATPVFADINRFTYNVDTESVKELINPKTKAIICVHLFGNPCDMKSLMKISEYHQIPLIEDAAQAHGSEYHGHKVGGFGQAGCFSFYATKNMTTGEGGMVTTNNSAYATKIREFINHGQHEKYQHIMLGYNYRMTDIAGAIGLEQLKKLPEFNRRRIENAEYYNKNLNCYGLRCPDKPEHAIHVYHQYSVRIMSNFPMKRDALMKYLSKNGINTAVHYPIPLHKQPIFYGITKSCPVAEELSEQILSIPVHPGITNKMRETICKTIKEIK